jgi:ribonuclease HI
MLTNSGPLQLSGSSFSHNAALGPGSYGGAVLVRSSSGNSGVEVTGCAFTNNSAELTVRVGYVCYLSV